MKLTSKHTEEVGVERAAFFPEQEMACNVDEPVEKLTKKEEVWIRKFEGLHGFADPYSAHHCKKSGQTAFAQMMKFLQEIDTLGRWAGGMTNEIMARNSDQQSAADRRDGSLRYAAGRSFSR